MKQEYKKLNDQTLLDLIIKRQSGWRDMLSVLLQRHHYALLKRCLEYLKNREDAEDAAQETELRAFRALRNFRGEASFRTWLFAIGDRQCYDQLCIRKRYCIDDNLRYRIEINEINNREVTPVAEDENTVSKTISRLPERERDVIVLRYYLDLSLDEISTILGVGLSATKMRLYRALDKFSMYYSLSYSQPPMLNHHCM